MMSLIRELMRGSFHAPPGDGPWRGASYFGYIHAMRAPPIWIQLGIALSAGALVGAVSWKVARSKLLSGFVAAESELLRQARFTAEQGSARAGYRIPVEIRQAIDKGLLDAGWSRDEARRLILNIQNLRRYAEILP